MYSHNTRQRSEIPERNLESDYSYTYTDIHTHVSYIHRDDVVILMPFDASIFYFHGLSDLWILPFHTTKLLVPGGILLKLVWLHIFSTQALLRFVVQAVTLKKVPTSVIWNSAAPISRGGLKVLVQRPNFTPCFQNVRNGQRWDNGVMALFASSWLLMIQNL